LHVRKRPSQSLSALAFQAGHASSILVTRSTSSFLVRTTFGGPDIFEHPGDNNDQAGHASSMIMRRYLLNCLVRVLFWPTNPAPCCSCLRRIRAQFVPNVTSFSFENRPLGGTVRARIGPWRSTPKSVRTWGLTGANLMRRSAISQRGKRCVRAGLPDAPQSQLIMSRRGVEHVQPDRRPLGGIDARP
jgi:hypothetical protein